MFTKPKSKELERVPLGKSHREPGKGESRADGTMGNASRSWEVKMQKSRFPRGGVRY